MVLPHRWYAESQGILRDLLVLHVGIIATFTSHTSSKSSTSSKVALGPSPTLNVFDVGFLLCTFHAGPLSISRDGAHVFLRSAGLERSLSSLEVASVFFGTDEGEDDEIDGHDSDEDTLDEGVIRDNFRTG